MRSVADWRLWWFLLAARRVADWREKEKSASPMAG